MQQTNNATNKQIQKQTNAKTNKCYKKNITRSTTKNKRNNSFKLNFLAQTHIPRHPCSPEPPYNILWHFLALTQKDITAWVDPIKGSNVNHRKKWGTNGVRGTQLYNQWTRHTIRLIKHWGPPPMQQLRFTSSQPKVFPHLVQCTEVCWGCKKSVDHIPQAKIYLGYMSRRGAQTWCPRCNLWTKPEVVVRTIHHSYSPQRPLPQTSTA